MQILINTSAAARTRVVQFTPWSLALSLIAVAIPLMIVSLALYHAIVLKAAQEHWPIISEAVRYVERKELAQRDHYMRENLDAIDLKILSELQRDGRMTNNDLGTRVGISPTLFVDTSCSLATLSEMTAPLACRPHRSGCASVETALRRAGRPEPRNLRLQHIA